MKIDIELAGYDFLQSKFSFGRFLIDIGAQHQSDVRNFSEPANPIAGFDRKFWRFEPVVGKINPRGLCTDSFFVPGHIRSLHVVLGRSVSVVPNSAPSNSVI